jgi:hypothetical protein
MCEAAARSGYGEYTLYSIVPTGRILLMILNLIYRKDLFHGLTRIPSSTLNSLGTYFRFVSCPFVDGAYGGDVSGT